VVGELAAGRRTGTHASFWMAMAFVTRNSVPCGSVSIRGRVGTTPRGDFTRDHLPDRTCGRDLDVQLEF